MNLLITGAWRCRKEQLERMEQLGHRVFFMPNEAGALPVAYESVEGIVCNGLFLHHPIERFTNLRYIQLTSAGFDRVPMDYVQEHGIVIHNARGVYSIPMAEFAVAGVLQLYKQSRFFYENHKKRVWEKHRGLLELHGKQVCIVGCGSVGTECAKRFSAFGCCVTGVDLHPYENDCYTHMLALECLDTALSEADVVVLTLPLTDESYHLVDKNRLEKMKAGAVLVNIARGAVVDTAALIEWLEAKRGAAVLDVFEEEPLGEENPLWQLDNVILTPHNSFVGEDNCARLSQLILQNMRILK